jgi:hypothetical protein
MQGESCSTGKVFPSNGFVNLKYRDMVGRRTLTEYLVNGPRGKSSVDPGMLLQPAPCSTRQLLDLLSEANPLATHVFHSYE